MKVTVQDNLQEILVSTISIANNYQDIKIYLVHCYRCGNALLQVSNQITGIFAGKIPDDGAIIISKCGKCKEAYVFQDRQSKNKYISLSLIAKEGINTFHCVVCRNPLLQYNYEFANILPSYLRLRWEEVFECIRPSCRQKYLLNEICS